MKGEKIRAVIEADELEKIEADIREYSAQIKTRCDRALEILGGRVVTVRDRRFVVKRVYPYFGGTGCRLYFTGPLLKQDGTPHARNTETVTLASMEKIERS